MPITNDPIYNVKYHYDSEDVRKILQARIWDVQSNAGQGSPRQPSISISTIVDINAAPTAEDSLVKLLHKINANKAPRIVLIPCKTIHREDGEYTHWAGILLVINTTGDLQQALYLDSANPSELVPNNIQEAFGVVFPEQELQASSCMQQTDMAGSGPFLIDNFCCAIFSPDLPDQKNSFELRVFQMGSLRKHNIHFYNKFVKKQSVSEDVETLFLSLQAMKRNLQVLFEPTSGLTPVTSTELTERFNVVCDTTGNLELQMKAAADNKKLTPYLQMNEWQHNKRGFIADYTRTARGPILGGALLSYARGAGVMVAREAAMSAASTGAARGVSMGIAKGFSAGALTLFDPASLVITAAFTTGSIIATRQARKMSRKILEASYKYHVSSGRDDPDLKDADDIMKVELDAPNSRHDQLYRVVRWFGTPNEQYDFAHLLWAQIKAKKHDASAMTKFQQVYRGTQNETLKAMSLIGQIVFLTELDLHKSKLTSTPSEQSSRQYQLRNLNNPLIWQQTIDPLVKILNKDHADVIGLYFTNIIVAYKHLLDLVTQQAYSLDPEHFAAIQDDIEMIIKYKDFCCLRYMKLPRRSEPIGKVAEVAFTYLQALCHILKQEYYKQNPGIENDTISSAKNEAKEALKKLQRCKELINLLNLNGAEARDYPIVANLLDEIEYFTMGYLSRNAGQESTLSSYPAMAIENIHSALVYCFRLFGTSPPDDFPRLEGSASEIPVNSSSRSQNTSRCIFM